MIRCDEDALICDLAETYGIFNYRELPVKLVATLSVGLKDDSRIKRKLNNAKIDNMTLFLAAILDHLKVLVWQNTKNGMEGTNHPNSILKELLGLTEKTDANVKVFDTAEDFENYRNSIINSMKGGNQ